MMVGLSPTGTRSASALRAGVVLNFTVGWSTRVCDIAGVPLPITTHILQAFATEPVKPLLDVVIVSSQLHVYISQSDRGEFVIGSEIEPWTTYRTRNTLKFPQPPRPRALPAARAFTDVAREGALQPEPRLHPILGRTELENFHLSADWGTYGFKAGRSWAARSPSSSRPAARRP
jgi:sarcosine oxidase, subunit beta